MLRLAPPLVVSMPFTTTTTAPLTFSVPVPVSVTLWKQYVPAASVTVLPLPMTRSPVAAL